MCGIVGTVGTADALSFLMEGLSRLEYRGYDSAGVAVVDGNGEITITKREGKLAALASALEESSPTGVVGIGHTRWATHGAPTTRNAHPHADCAGRVAVVHNGIIENHGALRDELTALGHTLQSDTDSEVLAHLIEDGLRRELATDVEPRQAFESAVRAALGRLEGAFAIAALAADAPDVCIAARRFSPLVLGRSNGAAYVASDVPALLPRTRLVMPLADDQMAVLTPDGVTLTDLAGTPVEAAFHRVDWDDSAAEKSGYDHYVRKEIEEQPEAIASTLRGRLTPEGFAFPELAELDLAVIRRVYIVAAGSSFYAGLVAKQQLESWAGLPVEVAVASEFRYGAPVLGRDSLVILITQSGETADTLAAQRISRAAGAPTLAVTNTAGSSVTRTADASLLLQVGPEIGVVATKTFTGQLALLAALAGEVAVRRGVMAPAAAAALARGLAEVPDLVAEALAVDEAARNVAGALSTSTTVLFIGRCYGYPIAMEAALKLKEISYIHAEGYPAGELKHGPIALIEQGTPVVVFAPAGPTHGKTLSNVQEVRARGAKVVAVAARGDDALAALSDEVLWVPAVPEALSPIVNVIPAQLLAYHAAVALGHDVDQPRNLAKSVTVE